MVDPQENEKDHLGRMIAETANHTQECAVSLEKNLHYRTINLRVNQEFAEDFLVFLLERKANQRRFR